MYLLIFLLLDKIPHRSILRKEWFISVHRLWVQSVMWGRQQELRAVSPRQEAEG